MGHLTWLVRSVAGAAAASSIFVAAVATPVYAASAPTAVNVTIGDKCVGDQADPNTTFTFDWKTAGSTTVVHQSVTTDSNGGWFVCSSGHLATQGDTVSASNGSGTNVYTVPDLTIAVDRVHGGLSGRAPAGSVVRAHCDFANGFEGCVWHNQVRSGPNGHWSMNIPFAVDGGQTYDVRVTDSNGNKTAALGTAPLVNVEIGSAVVTGALDPSATRTIWLYDGSMTVKGTAKVTGSAFDGTFSTKFRDGQGHAVNVAVGDTVNATKISSDATLIVPAISATATASNDRVIGSCQNTGRSLGYANVSLYRTGSLRGYAGFAGDGNNGVFDFNFRNLGPFDNEANVKPGDRLVIDCVQSGGDGALLTIFAS
jgi:hypothetical protein